MDTHSWILLALGLVLVLFCLPMAFMRGRRGNTAPGNGSGAGSGGGCSHQPKPDASVDETKRRP